MNAVDTNVLIYSLDTGELAKHAKAVALLAELVNAPAMTCLPWQVAGELLSWLKRWEAAGKVSAADAESHFRDLLAMFPIAMPNSEMFASYFELHSLFSLSHWDCMLLAACKDAGVTILYSEDLAAEMSYDGVTVENPFA